MTKHAPGTAQGGCVEFLKILQVAPRCRANVRGRCRPGLRPHPRSLHSPIGLRNCTGRRTDIVRRRWRSSCSPPRCACHDPRPSVLVASSAVSSMGSMVMRYGVFQKGRWRSWFSPQLVEPASNRTTTCGRLLLNDVAIRPLLGVAFSRFYGLFTGRYRLITVRFRVRARVRARHLLSPDRNFDTRL